MSYIRWGELGSDVYVYGNLEGDYVCCGCHTTKTAFEMIEHLKQHELKGDIVPGKAIQELRDDG